MLLTFGYVLAGIVVIAAVAFIIGRHHVHACPVWLRWVLEIENPFVKISRADTIIQHLGLRPGMTVLDIGCGPGRLTIPLARAVGPSGEVVALDLQLGMLRLAQERARAAGLGNIRFVEAKMGEGQLGPGNADRAVLVTVLGEIPKKEAALAEIFAALKPGGILSVTELLPDPHYQGRARVLRLGAAAGFREKEFFGNRFAFTLNLVKPVDA